MKTIHANLCFIDAFLGPWLGKGDDLNYFPDECLPNNNDEKAYKLYIERDIKPHIDAMNEPTKQKSMDCLRGILNTDEFDYEDQYDSYLAPLSMTIPPEKLYIWIWEVCFPDSAYALNEGEKVNLYSDGDDIDFRKLGY